MTLNSKRRGGGDKNNPPFKLHKTNETHIECPGCSFHWAKSNKTVTSFELQCKHHLCPNCFSTTIAKKGCNHFFKCPSCNDEELNSWTVITPEPRRQHIRQTRSVHVLPEPDRYTSPIQHHQYLLNKKNKDDPLMKKKAFLTLSFADPKDNTLKAISAEL